MKKLKLSETQIVTVLKEGEQGVFVACLCRKYHLTSSTYYTCKAK